MSIWHKIFGGNNGRRKNQLKVCMDADESDYGILLNFKDTDFQVNVEKAKEKLF